MPERHYVPCVITGNAIAVSKEKKTPSVRIALKSTDNNPRSLYCDLWLTDNAFEATLKTLTETLGWQGEKLSELNEPILKDIEVTAVCEFESYEPPNGGQPEWKERVVFLNAPGGGGGVKKLDEQECHQVVSRLDALMSRHRGSRGKPGSVPTPRRSAPPPPRPAPTAGVNDFPGYAPPDVEGF